MSRSYEFNQNLSEQETARQIEAQTIVEKINDPRLCANEDLEYFTLHLKTGIRHVPKRRIHEPPRVSESIETNLRSILQAEE